MIGRHQNAASIGIRGFTLVEAIITIVLTGILVAAVAVFVSVPVKGYLDVSRRADLTDIADSALRRIGRDLRGALPNSVQITGGGAQIQFIPIKAAGRYREGAPGNPLDFADAADTSFDVIGPGVNIAAGDFLVIYNLGITGSDAYAGNNRRTATSIGAAVTAVTFSGAQFPFASPARRFQVVGTPASYVCSGGLLTRYWNYAYGVTPPAGSSALLASNVSACQFAYATGITAQNALVTLQLGITRDNETVSLVHQVHVSNVP